MIPYRYGGQIMKEIIIALGYNALINFEIIHLY